MKPVTLPCGHKLPEAADLTPEQQKAVLALGGQITGRRRAGKPGGRSGGRPKSADRCPCGAMTVARAAARRHECIAETRLVYEAWQRLDTACRGECVDQNAVVALREEYYSALRRCDKATARTNKAQ